MKCLVRCEVMQLVVANMFQGPEGLHAIGEVYKNENEKSS